jgi:arabinofuranosyltransferase
MTTELSKDIQIPRPEVRNTIFAILISFFLIVLLRTAWVDEDAYITFRTISNFFAHQGLVYNVGERVQAFTHPLWLFLMSGFYYFFYHDFFYASIILSIVLSLTTIIILLTRVSLSTG